MITMASAPTLGAMWKKRIRGVDAPKARTASMYWLFFSESTAPRITRATPGMMPMPMTRMTLVIEGPRTRMMMSRSTSPGKAMAVSTTR